MKVIVEITSDITSGAGFCGFSRLPEFNAPSSAPEALLFSKREGLGF